MVRVPEVGLESAFVSGGPSLWRAVGDGPVEVHMNPHLFNGQRRRRVLSDLVLLSRLRGLTGAVRGMPDLLREKDAGLGVPVGVTFTMQENGGLVVPAGSPDTGCGYRCLVLRGAGIRRPTDLDTRGLLEAITGLPQRWAGVRGQFNIRRILAEGAPAVVAAGAGAPAELLRMEHGGAVGGADPAVLTDELLSLAAAELGMHGHHGHFVEVLLLERSLDDGLAATWDLRPGDLLVLLHTGSELLGLRVFLRYYRRMAEAVAQAPGAAADPLFNRGLFGVPWGSALGQEYLAAARCMMNYAFARRQLIGRLLAQALSQSLQTEPTAFELVSDLSHVGLDWEDTTGGRRLRHRRGAQPLLTPSHSANPGGFGPAGAPAVICGDVGIPSFLVAPGPGAAMTDFLVNHGMGRNHLPRPLRPEEQECLSYPSQTTCNSPDSLAAYMNPHRARLAIQNVHDAVDSLTEAGVVRPVARLQPVITFRGAPKQDAQVQLKAEMPI